MADKRELRAAMAQVEHPFFTIEWRDSGREPRCPPNPEYPDGIDIDFARGAPACIVSLPYPTRRCGMYIIECRHCGWRGAVTTAGRPDDSRSVKVPCKAVRPEPAHS